MNRVVLIILIAICIPALATDYYMDSSATGSNNGGSGNDAWQSISDARTALDALGDDGEGDTVYVSEGSGYGEYYVNAPLARTDWLIWQAADGESPEFDAIYIEKAGAAYTETWLKFIGITVTTGKAKGAGSNHRVYLQNVGHVWIEDCTFVGTGYYHDAPYTSAICGVLGNACEDITVKDCTFSAGTPSNDQSGFNYAVVLEQNASFGTGTLGTVEGCTITNAGKGITVEGDGATISDNTIYNCDQDGILADQQVHSLDDLIIEDNVIYNITPSRGLNHSSGASYNDTTGVITADTPGTFPSGTGEIPEAGTYLRFTDSGSIFPTTADTGTVAWSTIFTGDSAWAVVSSSDADTITLSAPIGCGNKSSITLIEAYRGTHCDGIQLQDDDPSHQTSSGIIVRRNTVYNCNRQGIRILAEASDTGTIIENNLAYNCVAEFQIGGQLNCIFRGNTAVDFVRTQGSVDYGRMEFRTEGEHDMVDTLTAYGNICGWWYNDSESENTADNYNLVLTYGAAQHRDASYVSGASTTEYDDNGDGSYSAGELSSWKANFVDYDNSDFRPTGDAEGLYTANLPSDDINGTSRSSPSDTGCYHYDHTSARFLIRRRHHHFD
jgi:hypothetical protein